MAWKSSMAVAPRLVETLPCLSSKQPLVFCPETFPAKRTEAGMRWPHLLLETFPMELQILLTTSYQIWPVQVEQRDRVAQLRTKDPNESPHTLKQYRVVALYLLEPDPNQPEDRNLFSTNNS